MVFMFSCVSRNRNDEVWSYNMLTYFGKPSGHPIRLIGARVVKAVVVDCAGNNTTIAY